MSMSGFPFKFDGIMSNQYGLIIANIKTDFSETKLDGKITYATTNILSTNKFYSNGRTITDPLTFDIEIVSKESNVGFSELQLRSITKWLFTRIGYHKLEIMSKDYAGLYFNCLLTDPEPKNAGVGGFGYKFTVICDAPWAWENPKTYTYNFTTLPSTINFINNSDYEDYLVPKKVVVTANSTGGAISIVNQENDNSSIQFTSLSANESITIDEFGQVTSSTGNLMYSKWNGTRFKFVNKDNHLYVTGNVSKIEITYQNARRIGY